jgi:hypothetical protein
VEHLIKRIDLGLAGANIMAVEAELKKSERSSYDLTNKIFGFAAEDVTKYLSISGDQLSEKARFFREQLESGWSREHIVRQLNSLKAGESIDEVTTKMLLEFLSLFKEFLKEIKSAVR